MLNISYSLDSLEENELMKIRYMKFYVKPFYKNLYKIVASTKYIGTCGMYLTKTVKSQRR